MINKVVLLGRVGKDPEVIETANGGSIAKFSIATSENFKDKSGEWTEKTEWHNIVMFGKQAEHASGRFEKGQLVYIEGKIQTRSWETDQGEKRYSTEIVANHSRVIVNNNSMSNAAAPALPQGDPTIVDGGDSDLPF